MITRTDRPPLLLRLVAPWAWRKPRHIETKLLGFAATEQGSALDMFRAADRVEDPRLRRLFFKHALDEARHAQRFRVAAMAIGKEADALGDRGKLREREAVRAERQDLYDTLGLERFVAFVYLSESRAKRQFEVLAQHFADHDLLRRLFEQIGKDEHFHATYSKRILDEWREAGHGKRVDRALSRVRWWLRWTAWRRSGHGIGQLVSRALLATLFVAVVPLFALVQRTRSGRAGDLGWQTPPEPPRALEDLRRQY